tara:strand:+ start:2728 stop:3075 length:348 start_codon:yes stop_codon:yes gene_type:complete
MGMFGLVAKPVMMETQALGMAVLPAVSNQAGIVQVRHPLAARPVEMAMWPALKAAMTVTPPMGMAVRPLVLLSLGTTVPENHPPVPPSAAMALKRVQRFVMMATPPTAMVAPLTA